jgi:hypothetical protein
MWSDPLAFFNFRTKATTREGGVRFMVAESATLPARGVSLKEWVWPPARRLGVGWAAHDGRDLWLLTRDL